jgi:hypothetical protein
MEFVEPESHLYSYELRTILNPNGWAAEMKKKGMRGSTLESIENRRQNRFTIRTELMKDKTGFSMNSHNSYIAIEITGAGFNNGSKEPVLRLKNVNGTWSFYTFKLLRPISHRSQMAYVAETSEGIAYVVMKDGYAKLYAPPEESELAEAK